jgi:acetyl esterase/lipase
MSNIHPELEETARRSPVMRVTRGNLWLMRLLVGLQKMSKFPNDVVVENLFIPGPDQKSKIRLRIYKPKTVHGLIPALLWFHGGGLVMGKPEIDDALACRFVQEAGLVVISVQYRLAPQHPFPAGLNDAYTALQWIHARSRQFSIDINRIGVGGTSAGGNIAAALAQMAHDRREIPIKAQHLIYPMLDDRSSIRSDLPAETPIWNQASNRFGWEAYLGKPCGSSDNPPYAIPARRTDLTGLPPAWIGVGTIDIFHDESAAYAQRLRDHGVECELKIVEGGFHGFDVMAPNAKVTHEFISAQIASLKKNLFSGKRIFTAVDMIPGRTYRVTQPFIDFDKHVHDIGESWIFVEKHFLPYDDGLTITTESNGSRRSFRMQWRSEEQGQIIDTFSDYVEEV